MSKKKQKKKCFIRVDADWHNVTLELIGNRNGVPVIFEGSKKLFTGILERISKTHFYVVNKTQFGRKKKISGRKEIEKGRPCWYRPK